MGEQTKWLLEEKKNEEPSNEHTTTQTKEKL